ncbi:hypothetical protein L1987_03124 [Smallanthus sonchifolius]|uniref:Uncharacterized protein n=1 Tax=Smallanthus sonchifolius TaxID=185202 RepID=A0ACB9K9P9_9ASTR|nr:hypothetical protein L1987_03124 [Smallanthus sonchifolius]
MSLHSREGSAWIFQLRPFLVVRRGGDVLRIETIASTNSLLRPLRPPLQGVCGKRWLAIGAVDLINVWRQCWRALGNEMVVRQSGGCED